MFEEEHFDENITILYIPNASPESIKWAILYLQKIRKVINVTETVKIDQFRSFIKELGACISMQKRQIGLLKKNITTLSKSHGDMENKIFYYVKLILS